MQTLMSTSEVVKQHPVYEDDANVPTTEPTTTTTTTATTTPTTTTKPVTTATETTRASDKAVAGDPYASKENSERLAAVKEVRFACLCSSVDDDDQQGFLHAWQAYERDAFGADEIEPLTGKRVGGWGGLGATLVDALDT
jgi:hypothetical protein